MRGKQLWKGYALLSLVLGVLYYFTLEQKVDEFRLTYSVSADRYPMYSDSLDTWYTATSQGKLSISANFESVADTLQDQAIRRFELRKFSVGTISNEELAKLYFHNHLGLEAPELISERAFGSNKPLSGSLGLALGVMALLLLVDFVLRLIKGQHPKAKQ
jgi:hypothetical protein